MSLELKVNERSDERILLEIRVDDELVWSIAVHNNPDDVPDDPMLLVWNDLEDDDPVFEDHGKKEVP